MRKKVGFNFFKAKKVTEACTVSGRHVHNLSYIKEYDIFVGIILPQESKINIGYAYSELPPIYTSVNIGAWDATGKSISSTRDNLMLYSNVKYIGIYENNSTTGLLDTDSVLVNNSAVKRIIEVDCDDN